VGTGAPTRSNQVTPSGVPGHPPSPVSYAIDVPQNIFNSYNCTGCHGASGGLAIACGNIVNVPSLEAPAADYVKPGDPGHSYLWCKVNPTDVDCVDAGTTISGSQMPFAAPPISASDTTSLKTWIQECAPNN
jgi:hypothetical protein